MSIFDRKKDKEVAEVKEEPKEVSLVEYDTSSQKTRYAVSARTNLLDKGQGLTEYRLAVKMGKEDESWRVMLYAIIDDQAGSDKTITVSVVKDKVNFKEAMTQLADFESQAKRQILKDVWNITEPEKGNVPDAYFETDHYVEVSEREGMVFDQLGRPWAKQYGHVVTAGKFMASDVTRSQEFAENAKHICENVEDGLLKETFETASNVGNLDDMLNKYEALGKMDKFVSLIKAMTVHESVSEDLLERSNTLLQDMKASGVYVEPFEKFLTQCDLAVKLGQAQSMLAEVQSGNLDPSLISDIRAKVETAEIKFRAHGATAHEIDVLRASVMTGETPNVPKFATDFIDRWEKRKAENVAKMKTQSHNLNVGSMPQKAMKK